MRMLKAYDLDLIIGAWDFCLDPCIGTENNALIGRRRRSRNGGNAQRQVNAPGIQFVFGDTRLSKSFTKINRLTRKARYATRHWNHSQHSFRTLPAARCWHWEWLGPIKAHPKRDISYTFLPPALSGARCPARPMLWMRDAADGKSGERKNESEF